MDSVDDTADMGVELKWGDGVFTVSSMKDHEGRWFITVQYDKTQDSRCRHRVDQTVSHLMPLASRQTT